ncbi:MAG: hypothetical protein HN712_03750 [Gemmatimonadetes bacterium]|nr:hypothetical protein [Gemmatimonadota bacterium]MBT6144380.1 hypothetical protein [Gemmatimonadota bacterium]MBT7859395.1 hypothetical protein [Gemmatimonadota bacterium]
MSRRTIHSVLLGVLLLILIAGSYSWVHAHLYVDYQALEETRRGRIADYDELRGLVDRHDVFADSLTRALDTLRGRSKVVLARENSKITFEYLNELATVNGRHMRLNLVTGRRHEFDRYQSTSYMIEGEASFHHLFAFLWKLEHYKRLYTIESLHWQETTRSEGRDSAPRSLVKFRMAITGYGTGSQWSEDTTLIDEGQPEPLEHNPFRPLVRDYIPPNLRNLLDVDHAQLQGLSDDRAFLLDHQQKLQVMREGDAVYLGLLTDIDKQGRYAEFTLNKGGFIEKVVLRLPQRR